MFYNDYTEYELNKEVTRILNVFEEDRERIYFTHSKRRA